MSGAGGWDGYGSVPDLGIDGLDDWARSETVTAVPFPGDDGRSVAGVTWTDMATGAGITLRDSELLVVPPAGVDPLDWFGQIVKGQQR